MTVDQAQQLRTACLEVRDRLGIPEGHFAIEAVLDLPDDAGAELAQIGEWSVRRVDSLQLRMPL